ncbi:MAG: hypothetical protein Q8L20_04765 [Gammaproteobacteria bacterium]|nr:hypothetical protein [Gammaproteobacteria bacterium]
MAPATQVPILVQAHDGAIELIAFAGLWSVWEQRPDMHYLAG